MRSLRRLVFGSLALFAAVAVCASGCQADFVPPSEIHGLRVLAVRPEPASGSPGATVHLAMLLADNRAPVVDKEGETHPPKVDIAWLGGCHNPPSRQYYACLPALRRLADPSVPPDPAILAEVRLHAEPTFDEKLPENILSAAPKLPTDSVHFGVSYVFFAVCTGTLALGGASEFPLTCLDDDGKPIGPSGFVIGFTTIYSFDGSENRSPVLSGVTFDRSPVFASSPDAFTGLPVVGAGAGSAGGAGNAGEASGEGGASPNPEASSAGGANNASGGSGGNAATACEELSGGTPDGGVLADGTHLKCCSTDADCAGVSFGHPAVCSANFVCAPLVAACSGSACPGYRVSPALDLASIESASGGDEIIWASYYATLGYFDAPVRLVVDHASGLTHDYSEIWKPPAPDPNVERRTARVWTSLNDQRGGATWGFFDVVVE
jgi:hypothetical protein